MTKPKSDGGYLLPDPIDGERICVTINVPDIPEHRQAFLGQLEGLAHWYTWQYDTEKRAKLAAMVWREIVTDVERQIDEGLNECIPAIGDIFVQFRLVGCMLQYSLDCGASWHDLGDICGAQGEPGEPGAPGEPGDVADITTSFSYTGSETFGSLDFDPETGELALVLPSVVKQVRQNPDNLCQLQMRTSAFDIWQTFADLSACAAPPTTPEGSTTSIDAKCLAAMNATEVLIRTYADMQTHLASQLFDDPVEIIAFMKELAAGIIYGNLPAVMLGDVAAILAFLGIQEAFSDYPWPGEPSTSELKCELLTVATADDAFIVTFDYEAVLDYTLTQYGLGAGYEHWGLMNWLLTFIKGDGLNLAGTVAYFTEPDCSVCGIEEGWEHEFDFTAHVASYYGWDLDTEPCLPEWALATGYEDCEDGGSHWLTIASNLNLLDDATQITNVAVYWHQAEAGSAATDAGFMWVKSGALDDIEDYDLIRPGNTNQVITTHSFGPQSDFVTQILVKFFSADTEPGSVLEKIVVAGTGPDPYL